MKRKMILLLAIVAGAIGRETIPKSRVSLKNDRSRRNILTTMILGLFLFSCGQKSNQGTNSSNETVQQQQESSSKTTDLLYYEKIAGTWLSIETEQTDEYMMSLEGYDTYYETGAYKCKGNIKISYFNIKDIGKVELNYTMVAKGKYSI